MIFLAVGKQQLVAASSADSLIAPRHVPRTAIPRTGGVPPPPAVWTAAILAAHECAFTYPSDSSTLTSATPSPPCEFVELFFAENGIKTANTLVGVVSIHAGV